MGENRNTNLVGIKKVKDIFFYINEPLYTPDSTRVIKIELGQTIGFNTEMNLVNFTLRIYFHYADSPLEETLVDIKVQNIFEVKNLRELTNTSTSFPLDLLIAIISMSISHSRALLLKNTAGTVFQDIVLPVTDPTDVAKHFFSPLFEAQRQEKSKGKKNQRL